MTSAWFDEKQKSGAFACLCVHSVEFMRMTAPFRGAAGQCLPRQSNRRREKAVMLLARKLPSKMSEWQSRGLNCIPYRIFVAEQMKNRAMTNAMGGWEKKRQDIFAHEQCLLLSD
jgi:hypothetical protein